MKSELEKRLRALESEHETGRKMLAELDTKRQKIADTVIRIEGAMQILRELLADDAPEQVDSNGVGHVAPVVQSVPPS